MNPCTKTTLQVVNSAPYLAHFASQAHSSVGPSGPTRTERPVVLGSSIVLFVPISKL